MCVTPSAFLTIFNKKVIFCEKFVCVSASIGRLSSRLIVRLHKTIAQPTERDKVVGNFHDTSIIHHKLSHHIAYRSEPKQSNKTESFSSFLIQVFVCICAFICSSKFVEFAWPSRGWTEQQSNFKKKQPNVNNGQQYVERVIHTFYIINYV